MSLYTGVSDDFCSTLLPVYFRKYGLINNKVTSHDKASGSYWEVRGSNPSREGDYHEMCTIFLSISQPFRLQYLKLNYEDPIAHFHQFTIQ